MFLTCSGGHGGCVIMEMKILKTSDDDMGLRLAAKEGMPCMLVVERSWRG